MRACILISILKIVKWATALLIAHFPLLGDTVDIVVHLSLAFANPLKVDNANHRILALSPESGLKRGSSHEPVFIGSCWWYLGWGGHVKQPLVHWLAPGELRTGLRRNLTSAGSFCLPSLTTPLPRLFQGWQGSPADWSCLVLPNPWLKDQTPL